MNNTFQNDFLKEDEEFIKKHGIKVGSIVKILNRKGVYEIIEIFKDKVDHRFHEEGLWVAKRFTRKCMTVKQILTKDSRPVKRSTKSKHRIDFISEVVPLEYLEGIASSLFSQGKHEGTRVLEILKEHGVNSEEELSITVKGFKTEEQVQAFFSWYSNQGEQNYYETLAGGIGLNGFYGSSGPLKKSGVNKFEMVLK